MYRGLLGQGLSPAAAAAAPDDLVDVLRLAGRRNGNARTVASLMHAIDGFRRPRPDSVMTDRELGRITAPTMFCWGTEDPFLSPGASPRLDRQDPAARCFMKSRAGTAPGWRIPLAAPSSSATSPRRDSRPPPDQ